MQVPWLAELTRRQEATLVSLIRSGEYSTA